MVFINEWLPNPAGNDVDGEWAELINDGAAPVFLRGWALKNQSGKTFVFTNQEIPARDYLILHRSATRLTFRNRDEHLVLYDAEGTLVDEAPLLGTAPEGKSLNRTGELWQWAAPTPGSPNERLPATALLADSFVPSASVGSIHRAADAVMLAFVSGILMAAVFFVLLERDYALSKLLFEKN